MLLGCPPAAQDCLLLRGDRSPLRPLGLWLVVVDRLCVLIVSVLSVFSSSAYVICEVVRSACDDARLPLGCATRVLPVSGVSVTTRSSPSSTMVRARFFPLLVSGAVMTGSKLERATSSLWLANNVRATPSFGLVSHLLTEVGVAETLSMRRDYWRGWLAVTHSPTHLLHVYGSTRLLTYSL